MSRVGLLLPCFGENRNPFQALANTLLQGRYVDWSFLRCEKQAQCVQKNYHLAVSNPCFELWLLLHVKSLSDYTDVELQELAENKRVSDKRTRLEIELVNELGSYNKSNPDTAAFLPFVNVAIDRARELDLHPEHRWPNSLGTRVYLLIQAIMA